MHHASLANRVEWETLTALASDHFPILCTISRGRKKTGPRKKVRRRNKKAHWTLFERKTEEACGTQPAWTKGTTITKANWSASSLLQRTLPSHFKEGPQGLVDRGDARGCGRTGSTPFPRPHRPGGWGQMATGEKGNE